MVVGKLSYPGYNEREEKQHSATAIRPCRCIRLDAAVACPRRVARGHGARVALEGVDDDGAVAGLWGRGWR